MLIRSPRQSGPAIQISPARVIAFCLLALTAISGQAQGAPVAYVQSNSATPQTPQVTVSVNYTLAQTAGNLNVVVVGWNDSTATVSTVTDSKGNAYAIAAAPVVQSGTASQTIYYAKNIAAAPAGANTVTVTFAAAATFPDIRIAEYSGLDPANPLDVSVAAQGNSSTSNSGSVTTTSPNDLLVGANLVQTGTTGPGAGYTNRVISNPDGDILEDRIVTTTSSYGATAPVFPSGQWIMQMAAFRAAGGSGGTTPNIASLNPTSGSVTTVVTISGSNFGTTQGTSTVKFNGITAAATNWNATSITAPVPAGATTGAVIVTVNGVASNGVTFTVTVPPPTIASLTPNSGAIGTPVTIAGSNFGATQGTSTVKFNGTTATTTNWTATSITAPVPAGATTGNVVVTVGGVASNALVFTVPPPSITSLTPNSGVIGTTVTIAGSNFGAAQGTSTVTFNGVTATPTSWSASSISVPVPNGAITGPVIVKVNAVASNGVTFTVTVPPPSINSLTPTSGPTGASVTVAGANFGSTQGTSSVTFNGVAAMPTSWSTSSIQVSVPAGATTGVVVVTVGGVTSNGVLFTVTASTPSITSLNPISGPLGTSVTIAGTNFGASQGTSTLTFNGTAATPTSWSTGSIVAPVPAGATSGNIAVTVGGVASNGLNFTVTPTFTAPSGLTAAVVNSTQINLSWTAATETGGTITQYLIERCAGAACSNFLQVGTSTTTAYFDAGLTSSTSYSYRVRPTDAANNLGPYSNVASATTNSTAPPISFVQTNSAAPQTPQTTVSLPYTAAQTAGDLNVVVVGWNDSTATVVSVADSKSNTYALAAPPVVQTATATQAIYYAKNILPATANANTVTVTFTFPAVFPDIRIAEYRGLDPANPLDVAVAAQGNSSTSNSGSVTTTSPNDLLVGANLVQTGTTGPGAGYTKRVISNPDGDILEDRIVTTTGSYSATAPVSPSGQWIMQMAAFRAASGTGGATPTAPSNLTATLGGPLQVNLSWTGSTETGGTISQYLIERCQGAGCSSFAQIATTSTTAFSDAALSGSTSYTYRVRAMDSLGTLSAYSNSASATTGLSISPRTTDLTFTRTQQFTASASVSWFVDSVLGGSASVGTISATGLYTPPNSVGTHTVSAQASSQSANATVYVTNYPGTFMRDVDVFRTGQNLAETVLTPANLNSSQFGKLFSYSIDGVSDASPLYVANVSIPGQGFHNVVYVATEHDSVYAFDAEGLSSNPLWKVSFINPAAGVTTITPADTGDCCPSDMPVEAGITGTPVIDPASGTLYVVAVTKEVSGSTTKFVQRLHALDIATGAEKLGGPVMIQATISGTGDGSSGGQLSFDALRENQRAALLLTNGIVYIAWGGHADKPPYHGWVIGYNAATLQQVMAYSSSPDGSGGGIWQSGDGLTTDSTGRIYFVTGNGLFDANTGGRDYGDSVVALNQNGTVSDYFTPHDQSTMASIDLDLGSGGALLLPDQAGAHPHVALTAGKNGTIYVVDRDNLGHFNSSNDNQILQALVNIFPGGTFTTGNFKSPVYFNGHVYFSADADNLKAFAVTNGLLSTSPTSQTSLVAGYPGATLGISANGSTNGILWAVQRINTDQTGQGTVAPGILHAYDASNLATELYNSNQAAGGRDTLDFAAKWSAPLIANGKVFVSSNSQLTIYGLLP